MCTNLTWLMVLLKKYKTVYKSDKICLSKALCYLNVKCFAGLQGVFFFTRYSIQLSCETYIVKQKPQVSTGVCFMNNVKSLLKQLQLTKQTYTVMVCLNSNYPD